LPPTALLRRPRLLGSALTTTLEPVEPQRPNPTLERPVRRSAHHGQALRAARRSTPGRYAHGILEMRGRLTAALGDVPTSEEVLRQASDVYRTIGATGHAERLARELTSQV